MVAYENGKMTVYERDGIIFSPIGGRGSDIGNIGLPASDAYANEINYFADCVRTGKDPEKVKPDGLEAVIDILKSL